MIIRKKRINKVNKYMTEIKTDNVYVVVRSSKENKEKLLSQKVCKNIENLHSFVPRAIGPATAFNADGKVEANKSLPKEARSFEHDYHIVDWHGNDHYGTCYQTRMCYQMDVIVPPCEEIILDNWAIRSNLLAVKNKDRIKHVANMFLEIFGECEILEEGNKNFSSQIVKSIPWQILPPGKFLWEKTGVQLGSLQSKQKNNRTITRNFEVFKNFEPTFVAIGADSFAGYIVFAFEKLNLYFFESSEADNATYVFQGNWKEASKLTKRDIILGNLCYRRIIHNNKWKDQIAKLMA